MKFNNNSIKIELNNSAPFGKKRELNKYYAQMLQLLEHNTNRLVAGGRNGEGMPFNKEMLRIYLQVSESNINKIISVFLSAGILAQVKCQSYREYYMNPKYAFYGDIKEATLQTMFNINDNAINKQNFHSIYLDAIGISIREMEGNQ